MKSYSITGKELAGSTYEMVWGALENGRSGLIKPDETGCDFLAERDYAKVAEFFEMEVSKCVPLDDSHYVSLISYNKRYHQIDADALFSSSTFEEMFKVVTPVVREELLLLAFVDCVCGNSDRHLGNIAFLSLIDNQVITICPPYDNVASFDNSYSNKSLLCPDNTRSWTHRDVFLWLSRNWSKFQYYLGMYESKEFDLLADTLHFKNYVLHQRQNLRRYLLWAEMQLSAK